MVQLVRLLLGFLYFVDDSALVADFIRLINNKVPDWALGIILVISEIKSTTGTNLTIDFTIISL